MKHLIDIYCINLDERGDRWDHMQCVAEDAGFALTRIRAFGTTDVARMRASGEAADVVAHGPLSLQQTGCALSHFACWQALLASDEQAAVVLEDDVMVAEGFAAFLENARWPEDADLIRIEAAEQFATLGNVQEFGAADGRRIGRLLSGQSGCGGYILTRKAAKKLVENHRKFDMPVDLYLCHPTLRWFKDLTIYQVDPAPVRKGCLMRDHAEAGWAQSSIAPDFFNYVPRDDGVADQHPEDTRRPYSIRELGRQVRAVVRWLRRRRKVEVRFG